MGVSGKWITDPVREAQYNVKGGIDMHNDCFRAIINSLTQHVYISLQNAYMHNFIPMKTCASLLLIPLFADSIMSQKLEE